MKIKGRYWVVVLGGLVGITNAHGLPNGSWSCRPMKDGSTCCVELGKPIGQGRNVGCDGKGDTSPNGCGPGKYPGEWNCPASLIANSKDRQLTDPNNGPNGLKGAGGIPIKTGILVK